MPSFVCSKHPWVHNLFVRHMQLTISLSRPSVSMRHSILRRSCTPGTSKVVVVDILFSVMRQMTIWWAPSHPFRTWWCLEFFTILYNAKSVCYCHFFLLHTTLCHWSSFREETTDLGRAPSSLIKIIRQTMFLCLRTSSGFFPSGKKLLRETLKGEDMTWCASWITDYGQ